MTPRKVGDLDVMWVTRITENLSRTQFSDSLARTEGQSNRAYLDQVIARVKAKLAGRTVGILAKKSVHDWSEADVVSIIDRGGEIPEVLNAWRQAEEELFKPQAAKEAPRVAGSPGSVLSSPIKKNIDFGRVISDADLAEIRRIAKADYVGRASITASVWKKRTISLEVSESPQTVESQGAATASLDQVVDEIAARIVAIAGPTTRVFPHFTAAQAQKLEHLIARRDELKTASREYDRRKHEVMDERIKLARERRTAKAASDDANRRNSLQEWVAAEIEVERIDGQMKSANTELEVIRRRYSRDLVPVVRELFEIFPQIDELADAKLLAEIGPNMPADRLATIERAMFAKAGARRAIMDSVPEGFIGKIEDQFYDFEFRLTCLEANKAALDLIIENVRTGKVDPMAGMGLYRSGRDPLKGETREFDKKKFGGRPLKVGYLGGNYNPLVYGHKNVAYFAQAVLGLDFTFLRTAGMGEVKKKLPNDIQAWLSDDDRLALLEADLADDAPFLRATDYISDMESFEQMFEILNSPDNKERDVELTYLLSTEDAARVSKYIELHYIKLGQAIAAGQVRDNHKISMGWLRRESELTMGEDWEALIAREHQRIRQKIQDEIERRKLLGAGEAAQRLRQAEALRDQSEELKLVAKGKREEAEKLRLSGEGDPAKIKELDNEARQQEGEAGQLIDQAIFLEAPTRNLELALQKRIEMGLVDHPSIDLNISSTLLREKQYTGMMSPQWSWFGFYTGSWNFPKDAQKAEKFAGYAVPKAEGDHISKVLIEANAAIKKIIAALKDPVQRNLTSFTILRKDERELVRIFYTRALRELREIKVLRPSQDPRVIAAQIEEARLFFVLHSYLVGDVNTIAERDRDKMIGLLEKKSKAIDATHGDGRKHRRRGEKASSSPSSSPAPAAVPGDTLEFHITADGRVYSSGGRGYPVSMEPAVDQVRRIVEDGYGKGLPFRVDNIGGPDGTMRVTFLEPTSAANPAQKLTTLDAIRIVDKINRFLPTISANGATSIFGPNKEFGEAFAGHYEIAVTLKGGVSTFDSAKAQEYIAQLKTEYPGAEITLNVAGYGGKIVITAASSRPTGVSSTPGGIKMSNIPVISSAASQKIEFAAIGPDFFDRLTFRIVSMKHIASLAQFASVP